MLLSADSLTIIFVKIYCYWTRTVGVIAKGSRDPVFFETQCSCKVSRTKALLLKKTVYSHSLFTYNMLKLHYLCYVKMLC